MILLPPRIDGRKPSEMPDSRQITIVGGAGAGKSRFMNALVQSYGARAHVISAMGTVACEPQGSIEVLYKAKTGKNTANELATDLDRLGTILLSDEFKYLLTVKSESLIEGKRIRLEPTKLDALVRIWQDIFPDNTVMRRAGQLLFATPGGDDLISTGKLSSSEKAVLYYIAAVLYAPQDGVIFVDNPALFLHPAMLHVVWNAVEGLRPDCTFVYNTSDVDFMNSRTENVLIWVRSQDTDLGAWDYEVLPPGEAPDDLTACLLGTRRPVLFIEGDATHSIDAKLYPLLFPYHSVRPLGSCNKVIEATRSFSDMKQIHRLDSYGIVDRDRRTAPEVEYLRSKHIMVPEVAEIENIFMLESVIRIMAGIRHRQPERVVQKVRNAVLKMFEAKFREQVLLHVRHRMKRMLETRGDARVKTISELEKHLQSLPEIIDVRTHYEQLMNEFHAIARNRDYNGVLRVFNYKPMLADSQVAPLLGYPNKDAYISGVLAALKGHGHQAKALRTAIRAVFMLPEDSDSNNL
ncbi:MAG: DUF4435 domain-containing protein [Prevotella sp.]|nr:DUF4435 domain-containing protein [Prevotella sp.]MCM1074790.1 DUF4435 domain-containing protein [Ruminococcus sp.]